MSELVFDEDKHEYKIGDKILLSVTQLMAKHGLAPDYSNVSRETLKLKAERGTLIHKEIENWIKDGEKGFTKELYDFVGLCENNNFTPLESEFRVHNDIIAGTFDILGIVEGKMILADIKTTAIRHDDALSWQLSIYAKLFENEIDELRCFDLTNNEYVLVKRIQDEEIEALFEAERAGEIYKKKQVDLQIDKNIYEELSKVQMALSNIESQQKQLELRASEIKNIIMFSMEQNGVKSFENELFKITYIDAQKRESIDITKLKNERPDIAEKYKKTTDVKSSIRITLRGV